nr:hypothetical protein [Lachnospiraceae bacterium]
MKKGIKILVLSALASLIMFAVVCSYPVTTHATSIYQETISNYYRKSYVGYTGAHSIHPDFSDFGTVVYRYTGCEAGSSDRWPIVLVYADNTWTELVEIRPSMGVINANSTTEVYASFDFTVNGIRYVGSNIPLHNENNDYFITTLNASQYIASAGTVSGDNSFVAQMYREINAKADEINLAAQGLNPDGSVNATKTVYYTAPSVNAEIVKALMKADGVSFVVTYNFAGFEFT